MCRTEWDTQVHIVESLRPLSGPGGYTEGWWVRGGIPVIGAEQTDIDVLVGVPDRGLLILEHKGWRYFQVTQNGQWQFRANEDAQWANRESPFRQAVAEEHKLFNLLRRERDRLGLPARFVVPRITSGVIFGNVPDNRLDGQGVALPRRSVVGTGVFCPVEGDEDDKLEHASRVRQRLLGILNAGAQPQREVDNTPRALAQINVALNPFCEVVGVPEVEEAHQGINVAALNYMRARAEGLAAQRAVYVTGPAGTGKTVLALQLADEKLRQARDDGDDDARALYVCFSELLAEEIRYTKIVRKWGGRLEVYTPEELLVSVGGQTVLEELAEKLRALEDPDWSIKRAYQIKDTFWLALMGHASDLGRCYRAVVVDEAQDFLEPSFTALDSLVDDEHGGTFGVFFDAMQVTRRERAGKPWERPDAVRDVDETQLETNYRNGGQIIDSVEECCELRYGRPDPLPAAVCRWIAYPNAKSIGGCVAEQLDGLRAQGLDPVVLATRLTKTDSERLTAAGVNTWHTPDEFKGLERRCIVLVCGTNVTVYDPYAEDLYVGLTRATVHLTVVHQEGQRPRRPRTPAVP